MFLFQSPIKVQNPQIETGKNNITFGLIYDDSIFEVEARAVSDYAYQFVRQIVYGVDYNIAKQIQNQND